MVDLPKIKDIFKIKDLIFQKKNRPRHIALTVMGMTIWARKNNIPKKLMYHKKHEILKKIIGQQIKNDIPILTFYLTRKKIEDTEEFIVLIDSLKKLFEDLKNDDQIHKNQIKVSILGKWYDLPRIVESIKELIESTKDYDKFYLNLCVNYEGKEEIVDACKLIARKIKAEKLDVESIDKELIKDNLYSSYFLPPDLIIITGKRKITSGILLWDSADAHIHYANKLFPEFTKSDFIDAIKAYQEN